MTPQQYEQIREQRAIEISLRIAREEPAETAQQKGEVKRQSRSGDPERKRAANRRHTKSDRGRIGVEIRAIRLVIQTAEKRVKREQDRLAYLQSLLAERQKQRDDIPVKSRPTPWGVRGVSVVPGGRFSAMFHTSGRKYYCGRHDTIEDAAAAIERKRTELRRDQ